MQDVKIVQQYMIKANVENFEIFLERIEINKNIKLQPTSVCFDALFPSRK